MSCKAQGTLQVTSTVKPCPVGCFLPNYPSAISGHAARTKQPHDYELKLVSGVVVSDKNPHVEVPMHQGRRVTINVIPRAASLLATAFDGRLHGNRRSTVGDCTTLHRHPMQKGRPSSKG